MSADLLVFDIGNTNIVVGGFRAKELFFEVRLKSDALGTADEYGLKISQLIKERGQGVTKFSRCIISSVVPPLTPLIMAAVRNYFSIEPLLVGPGIKTGIQIKISEPASVGADRIVNAVAAKALFGMPALIIDFGTATSFDYVSKEGNYEGGAIAPGLSISLQSLVRNTAKLPNIELEWPKSAIGKSTVAAMQAGAVIGYGCMVEGLIERIVQETGPIDHVIATGGLGGLIAEHSKRISRYERDLTLHGLRILAELNP